MLHNTQLFSVLLTQSQLQLPVCNTISYNNIQLSEGFLSRRKLYILLSLQCAPTKFSAKLADKGMMFTQCCCFFLLPQLIARQLSGTLSQARLHSKNSGIFGSSSAFCSLFHLHNTNQVLFRQKSRNSRSTKHSKGSLMKIASKIVG